MQILNHPALSTLPTPRRFRPARGGYPLRVGVPDGIDLGRHAELEGHELGARVKAALLLVLFAIPLLALIGAFGQRPTTTTASAASATLDVSAPPRIRSGLLYTARFTITAREEIRRATLELSSGWLDGMQVNTIEPTPVGEASRDGRLALDVGHVPAGDRHVLWIAFQVNPTTTGRRDQDVRLLDGTREIAVARRTLTLFP